MITVKLKKGLDIPMQGQAACDTMGVSRPDVFAVVPDHFSGITPRLSVHEGDRVKAGTPLFHDKVHEAMNFVSPVSGEILAINRGDRRKVMSITIKADIQDEYEVFDTKELNTAEQVKNLLLKAGLWMFIKQRPYDVIANPDKTPKAIFISGFDSAPLAPDYTYVLKGQTSALQAAVDALGKIAKVHIGLKANEKNVELEALKNVEFACFDGPHPAGNVGVQINHTDPINKGETVWTLNVQDLAVIGHFLLSGKVDLVKLVALTGPMVINPLYYRYRYGAPVSQIVKGTVYKEVPLRVVSGNVLSGHQVELNEVLEPTANQITVIAEGSDNHEFMGWIMPRFNLFSQNRTVGSAFLCGKKDFEYDARTLGGRRAIIVSGEYDKVFPMDIYPEYLIKAMIAGNLDRMEQLGAYEVAPEDFALCEYVCTSKLPLQAIVRQALDNMRKELE